MNGQSPLDERVDENTTLLSLRVELERLERQLIPLLITVQRLLGKKPTVMTREQRRQAEGS